MIILNREVKKKIRSQTGASLSISLLLFLVCATVGSVVLVAGTTAAGRMSQMTTLDQRYYCVSSAAELLVSSIHDIPVKVTRTRIYKKTMTYKVGEAITESESQQSDETKIEWGLDPKWEESLPLNPITCTINNEATPPVSGTSVKTSIIADAAQKLIKTSEITASEYKDIYLSVPLSTVFTRDLELTTDLDRDDLKADIKEIIGVEGNITLYVSNQDANQKYSLQLIFRKVNEPVVVNTTTEPGEWSSSDGLNYSKVDTITKVEITTVKWTLKSIKNMASPT